jgi:ubiquinone/menaquinone biosynthesis C-methylase UbiE
MKRTPEPELMDSQAQTRAYAEADFSDSNALFVSSFKTSFPDLGPQGRLIDLGCGPADICIRLANRYPGWQITGLDAGENMLKRAASAIMAAGMQEQVRLRHCRLPDDGLNGEFFDAVVSNSLLHHLPEPQTLWQTIVRIGRPGAAVTVMDLRRPHDEDQAAELVRLYAADAPDVLREDFYHSLLAAYTSAEVEGQLLRAGLQQLKLSLPSDRHWIVTGRLAA